MPTNSVSVLSKNQLLDLIRASSTKVRSCSCADTFSAWNHANAFSQTNFEPISTLVNPDNFPLSQNMAQTDKSFWSADYPICLDTYPENSCDVAKCNKCDRLVLSYVEFNGHHIGERCRIIDVALLIDPGTD